MKPTTGLSLHKGLASTFTVLLGLSWGALGVSGRLPAMDDSSETNTIGRELAVSILTGALVEAGVEPRDAATIARYDPRQAVDLYAKAMAAEGRFVRGDSNADGELDISDAIHLVGFLFTGGEAGPICEKASDANADGELDISDPVALFSFLFLGGRAPAAPYPSCGAAWGQRGLSCHPSWVCPPLSADVAGCVGSPPETDGRCDPLAEPERTDCLLRWAVRAVLCMRPLGGDAGGEAR